MPKYYVWNQNNRLPVKKHSTLTDATKEAERLSLKHPKDKFVVVYIVKYIGPLEA